MKRRSFIKSSALTSASLMAPSFLKGYVPGRQYSSRSGKILVIVQLSGGNDGLNTVIPYRNDIYYSQRPSLSIHADRTIALTDEMALNPVLLPLKELYEEGTMSILNSVGYPNPDRSHFRSMDIWQTGSASDEYLQTGWLGRYLDSNCNHCEAPHHALELDDNLSLALKGTDRRGFAMSNLNRLGRTSQNRFLKELAEHHSNDFHTDNQSYLYKVLVDTQSSAAYLHQQSKIFKSNTTFPKTRFGQNLKQIAELITADTDTRIYYVSLSGFDTHVNQKMHQERLLKQYAEGMAAFIKDLKQHDLFKDTLIMTFSEFGRRVAQNGSNGTDHGTANNVFLYGADLQKPGFFNEAPDLSRLDAGDLIYDIDFRNVYATILEKWLEADVSTVLSQSFSSLPLL